ncbi:MAG: transketolase C-terminal domain-containing protein [Candidatus Binatia bacterium]
MAAGLGAAAKLDNCAKRIFCIIGDGESREGQISEALDFILDHNLHNVLPIFNCNAYAQSDKVSRQQTAEYTAKKLEAIGYEVKVIDGHNPMQVKQALDAHAQRAENPSGGKPIAIVANTVKGWGADSMQGHGHHGTPVEKNQLESTFAELDETAKKVGAAFTAEDLRIPAITASVNPGAAPEAGGELPTFTDAMKRLGKDSVLAKGKWAPRRAYGVALRALGHFDNRIVVLDADVKNSTFAEDFAKDTALNSRFLECRIAEQNMVSVAAGLSAAGKIPFASTFAKFFTRAYDQIEMGINSGANLKLVGSHSGVSLAADGPSQMSLPDIAWFRAFTGVKLPDGRPAMHLLQPADAFAAYALLLKMAEHDGPAYMRTMRPDVPFLYNDNTTFSLGGHEVIAQGKHLLILASGYMVHEASKALDALDQAGVDATLVDLYSLPFNEKAILDLAQENNGMILTIEDNYGAGFGSAVADALAADGGGFTLKQMTVTTVPKSGRTPDEVLAYLGLSAQDIVKAVQDLLQAAGA